MDVYRETAYNLSCLLFFHFWPFVTSIHIFKNLLKGISRMLFSHSVMFDSYQPHGLQHTRFPCLSLSPGVCSNSCPLSESWHLSILSSVAPFSSCPQIFPASWSFPVSWLFISGAQSIGASVWASVLPVNIQGWPELTLASTGLISLLSKGLSRVFSSTTVESERKNQFFGIQPSLWSNSYVQTVTRG